jgi:hypothetical protein
MGFLHAQNFCEKDTLRAQPASTTVRPAREPMPSLEEFCHQIDGSEIVNAKETSAQGRRASSPLDVWPPHSQLQMSTPMVRLSNVAKSR